MTAAISARPEISSLVASKIREVANAGIGRDDVLAFWFGEPDETTPEFIRRAAADAVMQGDTFYTSNFGIAPLRETLAQYLTNLHVPFDAGRIAVTSAGVSALMMAAQTLYSPGDRVVLVSPVWPNLTEAPRILGAHVVTVPLEVVDGIWHLDVQRLLDALTPGTRALVLNSPNNPTGWVIERAQQLQILEHCRQHGIWIVSDDVYERIVFEADMVSPTGKVCAPSFLDIADAQDRLITTNSFSKSWLMTGWRLGWMTSPQGRDGSTLMADFGKLIEYNTSCAPGFVQQAGIVAVREGEPLIAHTVARLRTARNHLCAKLAEIPGVSVVRPAGAMYVFFRLEGFDDTFTLCKRLVREAGLGLAPGIAFGPEGEGYIRWCTASSVERIDLGLQRLKAFLAQA